ncbi:MAG TPA: methyltransferase domain-containing protein [Candidatus Paceibacterota bacterium]|nr:methyltransferase domain-containing protein [Candidatus Paceibacterota bacterium]
MFFIVKKIYAGQSLLRISMNLEFKKHALEGVVVDIGGGHEPDYFEYFDMTRATSVTPVDGSFSGIDFEKDALPFADNSFDTALCANVLEHVYNHRFFIGEIKRVVRPGGELVGFVPFLIQYHPDPHDYFRYTKEALIRMFADAGFTDIKIKAIGGGPFLANFNNLVLSVPRIVRVVLYPLYTGLDHLFLKLRPAARERYPLGFVFSMRRADTA